MNGAVLSYIENVTEWQNCLSA